MIPLSLLVRDLSTCSKENLMRRVSLSVALHVKPFYSRIRKDPMWPTRLTIFEIGTPSQSCSAHEATVAVQNRLNSRANDKWDGGVPEVF